MVINILMFRIILNVLSKGKRMKIFSYHYYFFETNTLSVWLTMSEEKPDLNVFWMDEALKSVLFNILSLHLMYYLLFSENILNYHFRQKFLLMKVKFLLAA